MITYFGGTFDPIHYGHVNSARELLTILPLQHITLLPCYQSAHRDLPQANAEHRLAMIQRAIAPYPQLSVSNYELKGKRAAPTVETLSALRATKQLSNDTPLIFVLGQDAFQHFHTWEGWQQILNLSHLIVVNRPTYPAITTFPIFDQVLKNITNDFSLLTQRPYGKIYIQQITESTLSATAIRQHLQTEPQRAKIHLPPLVWEYIKEKDLYKPNIY